jgi:hypothetical protein
VKALTVRQPWAWAEARGIKPIENRSRATSHRGPLAIHAGLRWDDLHVHALREVVHKARAQGSPLPTKLADDLPYSGTGLVIAIVDLVDVCTASRERHVLVCDCGPWAIAGQTHWKLANAQLLPEPVPATGRLGLWDWEP